MNAAEAHVHATAPAPPAPSTGHSLVDSGRPPALSDFSKGQCDPSLGRNLL